jgi:ribosomal protein L32
LVIANRIEKHIEIIVTTFWFYKSKEYIQFNDIEYIDMSVREITNDQGWSLDLNEKTGFGGRNPTQIYYVQARCKSSSYPLNLCRFVDQGIWNLGGFGIYLNDSGTESEGPQKKRADNYAELLSDYTGVELWSNRQVQFAFGQDNLRKCNKCGHEIRLSATICTYCGYEDSSIVNG